MVIQLTKYEEGNRESVTPSVSGLQITASEPHPKEHNQ